jgi:serine phosphatase RsbU (regulator of sigma subunit)
MFEELSAVDMFITAQLALVDVGRNEVRVASAGHCPLMVMHARGRAEQISPEGMPLGIMREVVFSEERISLEECQCAVMYTDGLTEARNGAGESFGDKRFVNWLKRGAAAGKTAVQLAENFLEELATFQSQDALKDDQTLLVLSKEAVLIGLDEMERSVVWQSGACAPAPVMD